MYGNMAFELFCPFCLVQRTPSEIHPERSGTGKAPERTMPKARMKIKAADSLMVGLTGISLFFLFKGLSCNSSIFREVHLSDDILF